MCVNVTVEDLRGNTDIVDISVP